MTREKERSETLTLHGALTEFSDHLEEIRTAVLDNMRHALEENPVPEPTGDGSLDWVRGEVRDLMVKERVLPLQRVVKAVTARLQARAGKQFAAITDAQIAAAKETPIAELCPRGVRGGMTLCPFHDERTPSLHISSSKNRWTCYGCGLYGDAIDFYQRLHGCDFVTAVKALS